MAATMSYAEMLAVIAGGGWVVHNGTVYGSLEGLKPLPPEDQLALGDAQREADVIRAKELEIAQSMKDLDRMKKEQQDHKEKADADAAKKAEQQKQAEAAKLQGGQQQGQAGTGIAEGTPAAKPKNGEDDETVRQVQMPQQGKKKG